MRWYFSCLISLKDLIGWRVKLDNNLMSGTLIHHSVNGSRTKLSSKSHSTNRDGAWRDDTSSEEDSKYVDDEGIAKRILPMQHEAETKSIANWLGLIAHLLVLCS
ncbi:hypothetical protein Tco_0300088 [Tanacetum coccineum]